MKPTLRKKFESEITDILVKEFNIKNALSVPKIEKVVVNSGVGDVVKNKELLEYYSEKLKKIDSQRTTIMDIIKQLDGSSRDEAQYKKQGSKSDKIEFVIKEAGKCLSTQEIVHRIGEYEPILINELNYKVTRKQIAGTISNKIKERKVFDRYKGSEDIYLTGLKEWFHSNGVVMDAFKKSEERYWEFISESSETKLFI